MSDASKTGGCLCGAVRFTLKDTPTEYGACHCSMCRKFSGGIELGVQVLPDGITWDADEDLATYTSSAWAERGFCRRCCCSDCVRKGCRFDHVPIRQQYCPLEQVSEFADVTGERITTQQP